ncbi:MAG: DUF1015 family protein [Methanolinea sp.]|jgi:uncharacterized protein (DUF1015 family)|nr:DUF1015 family protein [Methanolinea sp.]
MIEGEMVEIFRFPAVRPEARTAPLVAAVPYDVVTTEEAAACIRKNPLSFLRVSRSDAELPEMAPNDARVYARARDTFREFQEMGLLARDRIPAMYLYRVTGNGHDFLGLGCTLSVRDYEENTIRRHELTRYDKEEDRTRHIDAVNAHSGPVVLLFEDKARIHEFLQALWNRAGRPDAEVRWDDGTLHQVLCITGEKDLSALERVFSPVPRLYIADGHHRAKSAVNVALKRKVEGRLTPEATRFMGVLFAHNRVKIHGYSRLVTDLAGMTPAAFMERLKGVFSVIPYGEVDTGAFHIPPRHSPPDTSHVVHMFLKGAWYECACPHSQGMDRIEALDVSVLQQEVLTGILGISDPRGDPRLQYLGGARPIADLEALVKRGGYAVAFSMQPVKVESVLEIADAGGIMPPKSTWFEPKLLSGLMVHTLD